MEAAAAGGEHVRRRQPRGMRCMHGGGTTIPAFGAPVKLKTGVIEEFDLCDRCRLAIGTMEPLKWRRMALAEPPWEQPRLVQIAVSERC